jgi:hypothetical protein
VERFQMIDFESDRDFEPSPGFFLQKHEKDRWQALVDTRQHDLDSLTARGARRLSSAPVTLEDVFVALASH